MHLSVITPTWMRPKLLALTAEAFRRQVHNLDAEHVVVSDGRDPEVRGVCEALGYAPPGAGGRLTFLELDHQGGMGGAARDAGLAAARGEYCAFWDDDNHYDDHALAALYAAAFGFDVGVVQAVYHDPLPAYGGRRFAQIPARWDGAFTLGEIDTMCVCVRTALGRTSRWADKDETCHDFGWLDDLQKAGATLRFVPIVIGRKL